MTCSLSQEFLSAAEFHNCFISIVKMLLSAGTQDFLRLESAGLEKKHGWLALTNACSDVTFQRIDFKTGHFRCMVKMITKWQFFYIILYLFGDLYSMQHFRRCSVVSSVNIYTSLSFDAVVLQLFHWQKVV